MKLSYIPVSSINSDWKRDAKCIQGPTGNWEMSIEVDNI